MPWQQLLWEALGAMLAGWGLYGHLNVQRELFRGLGCLLVVYCMRTVRTLGCLHNALSLLTALGCRKPLQWLPAPGCGSTAVPHPSMHYAALYCTSLATNRLGCATLIQVVCSYERRGCQGFLHHVWQAH